MLSRLDKEIIMKLQEDLPLVPEPYKRMAEELGITEAALLSKVKEFCDKGILRRLGVTLRHREAGFKANAMVVWCVPAERTEEVGKMMASIPQVSHCYQRPVFSDWPYNMFTMVHGRSHEDCRALAEEIALLIQIDQYDLLYSTEELKKSSMRYFTEGKE